MRGIHVFILFVLPVIFNDVYNLEVIPEMVKVEYVNPKYATNVSIKIRRNGRNSPYVINMEFVSLFTVDDKNIKFDALLYEYLHNEYRLTFVCLKIHFTGCKNLLNDRIAFVGTMLKARGITCPLPAGHYILGNMTFREVPFVDQLPYKWPFQKLKVVITMHHLPEQEKIVEYYYIFSFKQKVIPVKKTD